MLSANANIFDKIVDEGKNRKAKRLLYFTEPLDAPFIGTLFSSLSPATIVLLCVGAAAIIAVPTVVLVRKKKKTAK